MCVYMLKTHAHIVTGNLLNPGQEKWRMVIGDASRCVVSSIVQNLFFLCLFKPQVHSFNDQLKRLQGLLCFVRAAELDHMQDVFSVYPFL